MKQLIDVEADVYFPEGDVVFVLAGGDYEFDPDMGSGQVSGIRIYLAKRYSSVADAEGVEILPQTLSQSKLDALVRKILLNICEDGECLARKQGLMG